MAGLRRRSVLAFILACVAAVHAKAGTLWPPAFRSTIDQFTLLTPIRPAPNTPIRALDGAVTDLDQFRGKVLLVNFWASWCRPCAYEMPSLDRLAAEANPHIAVIAVSIDRNGATAVAPYVASHHLSHLPIYLDPDQRLGSTSVDSVSAGTIPLWGLPITYVIDPAGRVIGYLTGAAKWDSPAARKFLDYFVSQAPS